MNHDDHDDQPIIRRYREIGKLHSSDDDLLTTLKELFRDACKVASYKYSLQNASDYQRADKIYVLNAISESEYNLRYASKELRADTEIILRAVSKNGYCLEYASEDLKANKEVVITAITTNPDAIKYASKNLQIDKEILLYAVSKNGYCLEYASEDLKADREVVITAITTNPYAINYASKNLQIDKKILLYAVSQKNWDSHMITSNFDRDELKVYIDNIIKSIEYRKFILHHTREKDYNIFHKLNYCVINTITEFLSGCQYTVYDEEYLKIIYKSYTNINEYFSKYDWRKFKYEYDRFLSNI